MITITEEKLMLGYRLYFVVYFMSSIAMQCFLLFLIMKSKSTMFKDMRIYLLNTLFLQFIVCLTVSCLQYRLVPNQETSAILCLGPCKYFGTEFCKKVFNAMQAAHIGCAVSLLLAFYYRYRLLTNGNVKKPEKKHHILLSYVIPLFSVICQELAPRDVQIIRAKLKENYPSYETASYAIIGFSDNYHITAFCYLTMLMLGLYGTPIIAFIFRYKILKLLDSREASRFDRITQCKSMVLGLTIQTILPIIFYIPVLVMFIYFTYGSGNSPFLEYVTSPLTYIYTITDPALTIYFVLPYRKAVKRIVKTKWVKNGGSVNMILMHDNMATV